VRLLSELRRGEGQNIMKARDLPSGPPTLRGTDRARPVLLALFAAIFIAVPSVSQDTGSARLPGFPTDWSHSHLIFTDGGSAQAQLNAQQDPRAQMQWMREELPLLRRQLPQFVNDGGNLPGARPEPGQDLVRRPGPPITLPPQALQSDWNFSLQAAISIFGLERARYPAKYTFAPGGTANCATDFLVYGLDVTGTASQANLIGVNNLYVGTTGLCGTVAGGGGSGAVPTPRVKWAYTDTAGPVTSSMVLNLTGTKVAYIANSSPATLRVLTLGSGTGTVTAPTNVTSATLASITLSSTAQDSSIFVDYKNDIGWVGDDAGNLYKITNLFTGTPTLASTLSPDPPNCGGPFSTMTEPVYDSGTDTVFVACEDGFLYGYTSASGTPVAMTGIQLAKPSPGIVSPPIVDSTNHVLYAFYGQDLVNGRGQVAQVVYTATPAFSTSPTTSLGTPGTNTVTVLAAGSSLDLFADGAFSRSYFSGFSPTTSFLYVCAPDSTSIPIGISLQQLRFDANRILSGIAKVATLNSSVNPSNTFFCSPITHFFNANTATDYLFLSMPPVSTSNVLSLDITSNIPGFTLGPAVTATVAGGTGGIIVDGADPSNQASSIYFNSLNAGANACSTSSSANPANTGIGAAATAVCAYKLTQSGLQ
jgi:hypothetical protein